MKAAEAHTEVAHIAYCLAQLKIADLLNAGCIVSVPSTSNTMITNGFLPACTGQSPSSRSVSWIKSREYN